MAGIFSSPKPNAFAVAGPMGLFVPSRKVKSMMGLSRPVAAWACVGSCACPLDARCIAIRKPHTKTVGLKVLIQIIYALPIKMSSCDFVDE
jgi:hypothetical protein